MVLVGEVMLVGQVMLALIGLGICVAWELVGWCWSVTASV